MLSTIKKIKKIMRKHWIWKQGMPIYNKNGSTVFYIVAPHHAFLGIAMIIMGFLCAPYSFYQNTMWSCFVIGSAILADDIIEHTLTRKTPLRIFFEWLEKRGWSYLR